MPTVSAGKESKHSFASSKLVLVLEVMAPKRAQNVSQAVDQNDRLLFAQRCSTQGKAAAPSRSKTQPAGLWSGQRNFQALNELDHSHSTHEFKPCKLFVLAHHNTFASKLIHLHSILTRHVIPPADQCPSAIFLLALVQGRRKQHRRQKAGQGLIPWK